MRILYLSASAHLGGAERCLLDLLWGLRQARADWSLHLAVPAHGPLVESACELGVSAHIVRFPRALSRLGEAAAGARGGNRIGKSLVLLRLATAAPATLAYMEALRRFVRALEPDVIHANGFKAHILAALCTPRGTPIIWHLHDYVRDRRLTHKFLRFLSSRCTALVANSHSVADDARPLGRAPRAQVLYNGIDLDVFCPKGPLLDLDRLAGLPAPSSHTIRVGLLATFARWKGHEVFLRAIAGIPKSVPVRGYIIGGPVYATNGSQYSSGELEAMASGLDLNERVGFTGFVDDRAAALRSLDIVVHASTQPEPFGLTIAEGMACGKPLLVSAAGGALELVTLGEDAISHPSGDAAALAHRIVELAGDAALRSRLGTAAQATALQRFDRRRMAQEIVPLYLQLAGAPSEAKNQPLAAPTADQRTGNPYSACDLT